MTNLDALIKEGRKLLGTMALNPWWEDNEKLFIFARNNLALFLDEIERRGAYWDHETRRADEAWKESDALRAENEKLRTALIAIKNREWPNGALKEFAAEALKEEKPGSIPLERSEP